MLRCAMPWDCDSYWRPDPDKDRDIWPIPPGRQLPVLLGLVALAATASLAFFLGA